jgi:hypothetical protein
MAHTYRPGNATVSWLVSRLVARPVVAHARRKNSQQREVGAGTGCFFISTLEAVYFGGRGTKLHFASYVRSRVWKTELIGTIFPIYSSDVLVPLIGWRPGQLPGWPALNPALDPCLNYYITVQLMNPTCTAEHLVFFDECAHANVPEIESNWLAVFKEYIRHGYFL